MNKKTVLDKVANAQVHCPICTHSVPAEVVAGAKRSYVTPGQKCPRCASSLDAAFVLQVVQAA